MEWRAGPRMETDDAKMIQVNPPKAAGGTVRQSLNQVVHDVLTLAELQSQLFKNDAREVAQRSMKPLCLFACGLLLLLAAIPISLIAIAVGLIAVGLPTPAAYASVSIVTIVVAAAMAIWAWRRLCEMPPVLARSREEFARNIAWIKDAITQAVNKPEEQAVNKPQEFSNELHNDRPQPNLTMRST